MMKMEAGAALSAMHFLEEYEMLLSGVLKNQQVSNALISQIYGKMRFGIELNKNTIMYTELELLLTCVKKYIKYIAQRVTTTQDSRIIFRKYCQILIDVVKLPGVRSIFLEKLGDILVESLEYEKSSSFSIELLISFNSAIKYLDKKMVHCYYSTHFNDLCKLADVILLCQNITYQFIGIQTLYYLTSEDCWYNYINLLYHSERMQGILRNINKNDFYHGSREFLNIVNEGCPTIFSLKCLSILIDKVNLVPHSTLSASSAQELWIDFNMSNDVISIICHKQSLQEFANVGECTESLQPISINANRVKSIELIWNTNKVSIMYFSLEDRRSISLDYLGVTAKASLLKVAVEDDSEYERLQKQVFLKMFPNKVKICKTPSNYVNGWPKDECAQMEVVQLEKMFADNCESGSLEGSIQNIDIQENMKPSETEKNDDIAEKKKSYVSARVTSTSLGGSNQQTLRQPRENYVTCGPYIYSHGKYSAPVKQNPLLNGEKSSYETAGFSANLEMRKVQSDFINKQSRDENGLVKRTSEQDKVRKIFGDEYESSSLDEPGDENIEINPSEIEKNDDIAERKKSYNTAPATSTFLRGSNRQTLRQPQILQENCQMCGPYIYSNGKYSTPVKQNPLLNGEKSSHETAGFSANLEMRKVQSDFINKQSRDENRLAKRTSEQDKVRKMFGDEYESSSLDESKDGNIEINPWEINKENEIGKKKKSDSELNYGSAPIAAAGLTTSSEIDSNQNGNDLVEKQKRTYDVRKEISISSSKHVCKVPDKRKLFDPDDMSYLKKFNISSYSFDNGEIAATSSPIKDTMDNDKESVKKSSRKKHVQLPTRKTTRKSIPKSCYCSSQQTKKRNS